MRTFRSGAGKGQVLGTAHIDFFASSERAIEGCSVRWDGDASFAPLLPAVAFDGVLPTLRGAAQLHALTEFEEWLDACEQKVRRAELPLLFGALQLVGDEGRSAPLTRLDLTMRVNHGKARVWAEARDVAFHPVYQVLWDWLVTEGPRIVSSAELIRRLQSQRAYYRAHGIRGKTGRAPFAAWSDSLPLNPPAGTRSSA